ncbi:hypothetical protein ABIF21_004126 [Bradyrhizobium elkanii]
MAPNRASAEVAIDVFAEKYGAKYDRAVECLTKDRNAMLAFYDLPAEHWDHCRRRIPSFATVRHRTVRTKGSLSSTTAKLMVFNLLCAASKTWRRPKGTNQLPKLIAGVSLKTASRSSKCRQTTPPDRLVSRVEEGRDCLGRAASPRFPSPFIKPDMRICRIRLSDWLHHEARSGDIPRPRRSAVTPVPRRQLREETGLCLAPALMSFAQEVARPIIDVIVNRLVRRCESAIREVRDQPRKRWPSLDTFGGVPRSGIAVSAWRAPCNCCSKASCPAWPACCSWNRSCCTCDEAVTLGHNCVGPR